MSARTGRFVRIVGAVAVGGLLVLGGGALLTPRGGSAESVHRTAANRSGEASETASTDDLAAAIRRAQDRLREVPKDWKTWADLGAIYVQQGRITADPSFYPKADGALKRSLAERPDDNAPALIGMGALAAAKHDFAGALRHGQQATTIAPFNAAAYGVVGDAFVELGRYDEAYAAVQKMVDLRPDTPSYARASYTWELRGDLDSARDALTQALEVAPSASDAGFALYYLGELAFNAGDLKTASARYDEGLARTPDYLPLLAGRAKVRAARGETKAALGDYKKVVATLPQPGYLAEYGDLLAASGDKAGADRQYALVRAGQKLLAGSGVDVDLEVSLFDADHGAAPAALTAARATYAKRKSVHAADALAWALHRNGKDAEALAHAKEAVRLGMRNALFRFHLGEIEAKLGQRDAARRDLDLALAINPHFSVLHAPAARATLASLQATR